MCAMHVVIGVSVHDASSVAVEKVGGVAWASRVVSVMICLRVVVGLFMVLALVAVLVGLQAAGGGDHTNMEE